MNKKIDPAKAKCTRLSFDSAVLFRAEPQTKDLTGFDIDAYTGAVVERMWGRLIVAVDGIQAKEQMPIFLNHDRGKIVGYSTSTGKDGCFSVQGRFSGATEAAAEVKALAAEGFPWQASIGVKPRTVLEIGKTGSMEVNGQTVQGPAEVWLESEVFETSFVPLGADNATSVTVFSEYEQRAASPTTIPTQEQRMDLHTLKKEHPELVVALSAEIVAGLQQDDLDAHNPNLIASLFAMGAQQERDRIAAVRAQSIPGHEDLVAKMELDGKSTGADAALAIVAAEKLARQQQGAQFLSGGPPAVIPAASDDNSGAPPAMKREAFNKLPPIEQGRAVKSGVKIVD
ncbi:hypothetical protein [Desulfobulbus sp.]|uniref:hypothetical protein n=1 Tax=Desulfobulbus sp. TaxID=895 RepID=UPI00286F1E3E|nr:hypothetical protein [Desulfobulbus sp.]